MTQPRHQEKLISTLSLKLRKKEKSLVISECLERNDVDEEVKKSIKQTIDNLQKEGHELENISFPLLDFLVPTYYVLTTAEASSNLARYDGIHFGYRTQDPKSLEQTYVL